MRTAYTEPTDLVNAAFIPRVSGGFDFDAHCFIATRNCGGVQRCPSCVHDASKVRGDSPGLIRPEPVVVPAGRLRKGALDGRLCGFGAIPPVMSMDPICGSSDKGCALPFA